MSGSWQMYWNSQKFKRDYATGVMCATVFFLFADQNLLAPNLSQVADDFHMSEQEKDEKLGGYISFGFFIVGGPAALLVGYLTDLYNRCYLFGLVVLIGESACLGTYWVQNFDQLLTCRVFTGVSIGGALPLIFSMLGDLYPIEARTYISTLIGVAFSAGVAAGQLLAGLIGPSMGWRAPFLFVAVPALCCGALMAATVTEPRRGDQEQAMRATRARSGSIEDTAGTFENDVSINGNNEGVELVQRSPMRDNIAHRSSSSSSSSSNAIEWESDSELGNSSQDRIINPMVGGNNVTVSTSAQRGRAHSSGTNSPSSPTSSQSLVHPTASTATAAVDSSSTGSGTSGGTTTTTSAGATLTPLDEKGEIDYSEKISWDKLHILFTTPTALLSYCQGVPGCLPWGMIFVFLNDYFSDDRGISVEKATLALTVFGVGGLVGQLGGGVWGQWLFNHNPTYQCWLMGGSTILGIVPMLYLINTTDFDWGFFLFMSLLAGFLTSITGPNVRAVLQNVVSPEVRGSAFAVFALTDDLGKGLGPGLVYFFIQAFDGDRQAAYNVVVLFWVVCGVLLLAMQFTVKKDLERVQKSVMESLTKTIRTASSEGRSDDIKNLDPGDNSSTPESNI
eukprot:CAMPEP_0174967858 /NCGR_PEP_ID=MMETSP0004_2-20121128/7812_1 /TAXON_ID=420556 /ORGANISM="Ochromonas sp., Strain CCMP1393" /LENGTH=619 /DNA_ID=CAMNT_0016217027 /DNA_START=91 /DNA_END=1950 /DNA_ORIENTATION=+